MAKSTMTKQKFLNQWLRHFASGLSKKQYETYVKDQFIWHVFSWNLLNADAFLAGDEARRAYDEVDKSACIYCDMFGSNGVSDHMLNEYGSSEDIDKSDSLWKLRTINDIIIAMCGRMTRKSEFGENMGALSEEERSDNLIGTAVYQNDFGGKVATFARGAWDNDIVSESKTNQINYLNM